MYVIHDIQKRSFDNIEIITFLYLCKDDDPET